MQLIYNEQKRRYEFLYTKAEMGTGYPLVKANNFQFDGQANPKVWFTASARRAIKLASYADDALRERILRDAGDEPDPDACLIEYHEALQAPRAKGAAGFTWHAPYQLNPFVKGRGWQYTDQPNKHWWTTQGDHVRATLQAIAGFNESVTDARMKVKLHVSETARAEVEAQAQIKAASIAASRATSVEIDLPCPDGLAYLPYQRAGIAYSLDHPQVLIGDAPRLGKTIQAIGIANADPSVRWVLVICPATIKINWKRELKKWLVRPSTVAVLSGKPNGHTPAYLETLLSQKRAAEVRCAVVNYDILKWWLPQLAHIQWDLVIGDESHKIKNPKAQRTQAVLALEGRRFALLTGTPILNRPVELVPQLKRLDVLDSVFGGEWQFKKQFCGAHNDGFGWRFDGATNLDILQERLRATCMIRRLKEEVWAELPPKRRQVIELPVQDARQRSLIEAEATAERRKEDLRRELRARVELAKASDDPGDYSRAVEALRSGMSAAFDEISRLRHETAIAKIPQAIEHLHDVLEETDKIIVFAHHRDLLERVQEEFGAAAVLIYGGLSNETKQAAVDRFHADPSCRVFICALTTTEGLPLHAASTEIFLELDWTPGVMTQAEDRADHPDKRDMILVQHLVLEGSIDAKMAMTLVAKQDVADRALDHRSDDEDVEPAMLPQDVGGDEDLELPEKREAGYAPEEIVRVRYEPSAYEERAATHGVTQAQIGLEALKMTPERIALVHAAVRELAGWCDGAVTRDDAGYNGTDARIGHNLAARPALSPKAAALAKFIIRKYAQTQLGGRYNELFT
jgi:SWI/SNF-related matrix-associated actin-dependent regulator 1 of chromatin subfamily A